MVLDLNKVAVYLEDIAYGFSADLVDLIVIIASLLLFTVLLIAIYLLRRRQRKQRYREQSEQAFEKWVGKAGLTPEEREAAEKLAELYSPDGTRKHLILENQGVFNSAVRTLEPTDDDLEKIRSLRLKLKFKDHTEKSVSSTIELGPGQHLYIVTGKNEKPIHGRIKDQKPEGMVVEYKTEKRTIEKGRKVNVLFHRGSGVYSFLSKVVESGAGTAVFEHSDTIAKAQRRNYYRRRLDMPAEVWKEGMEREQKYCGHLFDLGGGGAGVDFHSQPPGFSEGDRYVINLRLPDAESLRVAGTVVRVSKNGKRVHFEFQSMPEGKRDGIMKQVLQG